MHGQFHYLYRGLGDAGLVVAMAEARGTESAGRSDVGGSTSGWLDQWVALGWRVRRRVQAKLHY